MTQRIRLKGLTSEFEGRTWESDTILRAGRLASLDIVLDDNSVSRQHAEVKLCDQTWVVRDLNSTNGTFVNGIRLQRDEERPLQPNNVIQFGKVALLVEGTGDDRNGVNDPGVQVQAITRSSWEEAVPNLVFDRNRELRPGEQLMALIRAGQKLGDHESEEELLHSILNDAVGALDAQRGAIVLAEGPSDELQLKALASGRNDSGGRFQFSRNLAQRCFSRGESLLCTHANTDPELATYQSIAEGSMASVLCVLLRTPRKRLGILHLDRSHWQKPFTVDELHLADALAASVSAGIESAQLLRKQRELFIKTIEMLAQTVELRDPYTGGHTMRVTNYSLLLAQHLALPTAEIHLIRVGTPLHDIGKIGIDDAILRKPEKLTQAEFEIMKKHTVKGAEIISGVPDLLSVVPIVRSHHERWDGMGYPDKLAGEQIHRLARIVAVADAFDAMTSDRPYHPGRRGKPADVAFEEVQMQSGRQFDPQCAEAFVAIRERIVEQMRSPKPLHSFEFGRPLTLPDA